MIHRIEEKKRRDLHLSKNLKLYIDNTTENIYKDEKFFITNSTVNKYTDSNLRKVFVPNKNKKFLSNYPLKLLEIKTQADIQHYKSSNTIFGNSDLKKLKLFPLNTKSKQNNREFPIVTSTFTKSLNKEFSLISTEYGELEYINKFNNNSISNDIYENQNFLGFKVAKIIIM